MVGIHSYGWLVGGESQKEFDQHQIGVS